MNAIEPTQTDTHADALVHLRGDPTYCSIIPVEFAREHGIIGIFPGPSDQLYVLAIAGRASPASIWNVGTRLRRTTITQHVTDDVMTSLIDAAYAQKSANAVPAIERASADAVTAELLGTSEALKRVMEEADRDLLASDGKAPVVQVVDQLILNAVQRGASDLHLQPLGHDMRMRLRIDGLLDAGTPLPSSLAKALVSRIKVIGRMDVAERLIPQDGRASVVLGERTIDLRISTIPTAFGERVVVRLLDAERGLLDLNAVGMPASIQREFLIAANRASGIILVTGPTGSGKTTTLYAALRQLQVAERNIMTIEDPIEYELSALGIPISQTQVNARKGVTFANGLRHLLRQDPDVILVGEIRDQETARLAIQASLTGHLVFSTLHTNDAASAVARLLDLGIEPYLVATSLTQVLAQRLVRTVCTLCAGTGQNVATNVPSPTPSLDESVDSPCGSCQGSGFHGRVGIFELLPVSVTVRQAIGRGASAVEIRQAAIADGMEAMDVAGSRLVAEGRTTASEVARVIHHG